MNVQYAQCDCEAEENVVQGLNWTSDACISTQLDHNSRVKTAHKKDGGLTLPIKHFFQDLLVKIASETVADMPEEPIGHCHGQQSEAGLQVVQGSSARAKASSITQSQASIVKTLTARSVPGAPPSPARRKRAQ